MKKLNVEFYKMYEPGEYAAPILNPEYSLCSNFDFLPNYKDTIFMKGKKYFVHDVIHTIGETLESKTTIKAYRKVKFNEIETQST